MNKEQRERKPILNQPSDSELSLKAEIKRVNALLRENHNPHTYRQNKRYLERLERKLRQCQTTKNN